MAELLRLVLTNFWPFIAALILLSVICNGIVEIARAFVGADRYGA